MQFIRCKIGNGKAASFWFDSWTPLGPLINPVGRDGPRNLRLPLHATVSESSNDEGWLIPAPRSDQEIALHVYLTSISLPASSSGSDAFGWFIGDVDCRGSSSAKTWNVLRPIADLMTGEKSIWFKGATPKHAFNMWTGHVDRLPTKTRLASWGMQTTCGLCSLQPETRDHLVFACSFALVIWNEVFSRLGHPIWPFNRWENLIFRTNTKSGTSSPTLRKLVVQAVLYAIWKQRNNKHHNLEDIPPAVVFKDITINAHRQRKRFCNLMLLWLR